VETAHLFDLARAATTGAGSRPARRRTGSQQVPESVQALLDAMISAPAVVLNRHLDNSAPTLSDERSTRTSSPAGPHRRTSPGSCSSTTTPTGCSPTGGRRPTTHRYRLRDPRRHGAVTRAEQLPRNGLAAEATRSPEGSGAVPEKWLTCASPTARGRGPS
jgi:hypothetical protein